MSIIEIYESALNQMKAQAEQVRNEAYIARKANLNAECEAYKNDLRNKLDAKIAELNAALTTKVGELNKNYADAIAKKEEDAENLANLYADAEKSKCAKEIENLEKKIAELNK